MERKNTISGDETAGMVFVSYYGDRNTSIKDQVEIDIEKEKEEAFRQLNEERNLYHLVLRRMDMEADRSGVCKSERGRKRPLWLLRE